MNDTIAYVGEHAWAGTLGHVLTSLSFGGAFLSLLAYFTGAFRGEQGLNGLGRIGFRLHTAAVFGIIGLLFVMLLKHWFEFDYVWKHSNTAMPLRYILSCFWEGQEGSFLLWTFWHVVLGNILLRRAGEWEAPVMTVFALVQAFLATMLLGVWIGDVRVGSSPFLLIRELPENLGLPWTQLPDYLTKIPQFADGRGLNPLLQNYWMTIHPPTLFLGFAATLVPFAYAIAGLWKRQYSAWIGPALPWTFFGVMVLGVGILMGGAWAYEALSFGGFWAWDPVENASLVPWLTLVGAGHLMLVNKRKGTSLFTTLFLTLLTFILVLYSTFLTRSGVLGDTSVHSFTGEGMLPGLLLFLLSFIMLSVAMLNEQWEQRRFYLLISGMMLVLGAALQVQVAAIVLFAITSVVMLVVGYRTSPFHLRPVKINYDIGSSDLRSEGVAKLEQVILFMKSNPDLLVEVVGHTDNVGDAKINEKLSAQRANVVCDAIVAKGGNGRQLVAIGLGSLKPIAPNTTEDGRSRNRRVEITAREENVWSREFWLFIGALVLVLSAAQITFSTSVPVFNLLLEPFGHVFGWLADKTGIELFKDLSQAKLAPPGDAKAHYNKWQIPFAFIVALLVAIGQFLSYKDTDMKRFGKRIGLHALIALALTVLGVVLLDYKAADLNLIALYFATAFAAVANAGYLVQVLKGKWDGWGPSVAHVGFALVLLGALISTSRQQEISRNLQGPDLRLLNEGFDNGTDMLLYKGDTMRMGPHFVTFTGRRQEGVNLHFDMDYLAAVPSAYVPGDTVRVRNSLFRAKAAHTASIDFLKDLGAGLWEELENYPRRALWHAERWGSYRPGAREFALEPFVQLNPRFGNVAEPSTRHWLTRDLYTHIRYAKLDGGDTSDYMPPRTFEKKLGESIVTPTSIIRMDSLRTVRDSVTRAVLGPEFTAYSLRVNVCDVYDSTRCFEARPVLITRFGEPVASKGFELPELKMRLDLKGVKGDTVVLDVSEREFVILQAIVFPGINILWVGCVLMALGTFMAVRQRIRRRPATA
ncbi:MAG: cytochrome c biogenesis protein CcsA [Flavobacteriales bacterium]|nr:cytochrome c biogenesis protein CcsA [Flavobacteriales bacterium]